MPPMVHLKSILSFPQKFTKQSQDFSKAPTGSQSITYQVNHHILVESASPFCCYIAHIHHCLWVIRIDMENRCIHHPGNVGWVRRGTGHTRVCSESNLETEQFGAIMENSRRQIQKGVENSYAWQSESAHHSISQNASHRVGEGRVPSTLQKENRQILSELLAELGVNLQASNYLPIPALTTRPHCLHVRLDQGAVMIDDKRFFTSLPHLLDNRAPTRGKYYRTRT